LKLKDACAFSKRKGQIMRNIGEIMQELMKFIGYAVAILIVTALTIIGGVTITKRLFSGSKPAPESTSQPITTNALPMIEAEGSLVINNTSSLSDETLNSLSVSITSNVVNQITNNPAFLNKGTSVQVHNTPGSVTTITQMEVVYAGCPTLVRVRKKIPVKIMVQEGYTLSGKWAPPNYIDCEVDGQKFDDWSKNRPAPKVVTLSLKPSNTMPQAIVELDWK